MKHVLTYLFLLQNISTIYSQADPSPEFVTIIPAERYSASRLHEWLFGELWRDVWATPVKVEVLNLEKFSGGLAPIGTGGGFQTKSLQLKGNDGRWH